MYTPSSLWCVWKHALSFVHSFLLTFALCKYTMNNLFKQELQKSPALPPSCPDYYADLRTFGGTFVLSTASRVQLMDFCCLYWTREKVLPRSPSHTPLLPGVCYSPLNLNWKHDHTHTQTHALYSHATRTHAHHAYLCMWSIRPYVVGHIWTHICAHAYIWMHTLTYLCCAQQLPSSYIFVFSANVSGTLHTCIHTYTTTHLCTRSGALHAQIFAIGIFIPYKPLMWSCICARSHIYAHTLRIYVFSLPCGALRSGFVAIFVLERCRVTIVITSTWRTTRR